MPRHSARKTAVIVALVRGFTSLTSKKLQRKPLIKYTTGFASVTFYQSGGSIESE